MEIWQIDGAEDLLCTQYDQTIWETGTGPFPVADTHPNCRCQRLPFASVVDPGFDPGAPINIPGDGGGTSSPAFPAPDPPRRSPFTAIFTYRSRYRGCHHG